jgi:hypothetical protein
MSWSKNKAENNNKKNKNRNLWIKTRKIKKFNITKNWFFENINKIYKPHPRLTKRDYINY